MTQVQEAAAAPRGTPSFQASSGNGQRSFDIRLVVDALFLALPEITPLLESLIEDMNDKQLENLESTMRLILPFMKAFVELQVGADGIDQKEEDLLNEIEFISNALVTFVHKKKNRLTNLRQSTSLVPETIPDYTDLLVIQTPLPDHTPVQIENNVPASKSLHDNSPIYSDYEQDKLPHLKAAVPVGRKGSETQETSAISKPEKTHPDVRLKDGHQRFTSHRYDLFFKPTADHAEDETSGLSFTKTTTSASAKQKTDEHRASTSTTPVQFKEGILTSLSRRLDTSKERLERLGAVFFTVPGNGHIYMSRGKAL